MLEHYAVYGQRFPEDTWSHELRWRIMASLLLKGLSFRQESVRQEVLRVVGEKIFASTVLSLDDKRSIFTLTAKKFLFLIHEQKTDELTFFYTAAALSHIYRFIVRHRIQSGPFQFEDCGKVAFFPGTFDPFSIRGSCVPSETWALRSTSPSTSSPGPKRLSPLWFGGRS